MRLVGKDEINDMHINDINSIGFCPGMKMNGESCLSKNYLTQEVSRS